MGNNEPSEIAAYSPATDTHYPNWDALVKAEANGLVVTAVLKSPGGVVFTVAIGPVDNEHEANKTRRRIRARHKKQVERGETRSELLVITVRPLWKEF